MTVTRRERARPMSPEQRRAAIIAATLPLLARHGGAVSTRQIAEAAGVAEGTIFRVFDDKRSLFLAVAEELTHPPGARAAMAAGLADLGDLHARVVHTVEHLVARMEQTMLVMMALRSALMADGPPDAHGPPDAQGPPREPGPPAFVRRAQEELTRDLSDLLFAPHAAELRVTPDRAALVLRSLILGAWHPGLPHGERQLSPADIADVVLDGVRTPAASPSQAARPTPSAPREDTPC